MASVLPTPMINAKVYRHFAATTIAITLIVALFANGEARQAIGDEAAQRQQQAALRQQSAERFGTAKLGDRRTQHRSSGFGEDYDAAYGQSEDPASSAADTVSVSPRISAAYAGPRQSSAGAQATQAQFEAMSPEQQLAYLENVRRRRAASAGREEVDPAQIAALRAASAARSGTFAED